MNFLVGFALINPCEYKKKVIKIDSDATAFRTHQIKLQI